MESKDALAFVNYKYFRTSPENRQKYLRAFFYVSKRPRVLNLVGGGGRLWVVTSSRKENADRIYSLAYKLDNCEPFEVWPHLQEKFGNLGVSADPGKCCHFPSNNLTDLLMSLVFVPAKPISKRTSIGMSIMVARQLSQNDVKKMLAYEDKVLHGEHVFISYSSKNTNYADGLQRVLESAGHSVWRDVRSIVGGDYWEPEIFRAIDNANVVIVIVSPESAASTWVKEEIALATSLLGGPGKVKRLIPIVIDENSWSLFPDLHVFQKISESGDGSGFRRVAKELRNI
jgi:hypothetical protein